jgi:biotin operon repressor
MGDLIHYGTPRHSGRYPWGSGKNPQRNKNFLTREKELKDQGLSEKERAAAFGMSVTELRAKHKIAINERDKELQAEVFRLKEKGYSNTAIAERLGKSEGFVRYALQPSRQQRVDSTTQLAEVLKSQVEEHPYLDIGKGVELQLDVSSTQLKTAAKMLEEQGYKIHSFEVPQVSDPSHKTPMLVLTKDDVTYKEVRENQDKISSPEGVYFEDHGTVLREVPPPVNLNSSRIAIRYAEDGGEDKDGVIELRKGVPDISLGASSYAQVRIAVDGTHYLKGMAIYSNNMPDGVDVIFNTNKSKGVPMMSEDKDNSVLKSLKSDPTNPFGAVTRPGYYTDSNGERHQTVMNIVNDDSDWDKWSRNLSAQFLSKQPVQLAKRQLDLAYKQKEQQYEDIMALTNPTIKRKLLNEFSDECDSAAVNLKAAALPRQGTYVILPITSLKDNEVYAPRYNDGEEVVLIRYPHAGKFEIPKLIVNNHNKDAKDIIGSAEHAIGINSNVAKQLSGADFDGDTVVLIPTRGQKISSSDDVKISSSLRKLKDFNPSDAYPAYPGMKRVGSGDGFNKQTEMGKVSNLITDMTIKNASDDEIARAVRHSMVVIDAEKHNLNWKQSYNDNGIAALKAKYQGGADKGASTLISKSKSEIRIPERKDTYVNGGIDPETGKKIFRVTGRTYEVIKKDSNGNYIHTGKYKEAQTKLPKMLYVDDAYELSSGTVIEDVYASHANRLKALANKARKSEYDTPKLIRDPSATKTYAKEVATLKAKLNVSKKSAPFERQAQLIANKIVSTQLQDNPEIKDDKDKLKKVKSIAINTARARLAKDNPSAGRHPIEITDSEWTAIQSGAISDSMLSEILRYSDPEALKKRATPHESGVKISASTISRARAWLNAGHTQAEVAQELGISTSALSKALKEGV